MIKIDSVAESVNMPLRRQRRLPPPRYNRLRVENYPLEEQMRKEEEARVVADVATITTTMDE